MCPKWFCALSSFQIETQKALLFAWQVYTFPFALSVSSVSPLSLMLSTLPLSHNPSQQDTCVSLWKNIQSPRKNICAKCSVILSLCVSPSFYPSLPSPPHPPPLLSSPFLQVPRHPGPPFPPHDLSKGHPPLPGPPGPGGPASTPGLSQVTVPAAPPYRYIKGWEAGGGVSVSVRKKRKPQPPPPPLPSHSVSESLFTQRLHSHH